MQNVVITPFEEFKKQSANQKVRAYPSLRRLVTFFRILSFFLILATFLGTILGLSLILASNSIVGISVLLTSIILGPIHIAIMLAYSEMLTLSVDMAGDLYNLTRSTH